MAPSWRTTRASYTVCRWHDRAREVMLAFNERFWSEEFGAYRDGRLNALAVAFELPEGIERAITEFGSEYDIYVLQAMASRAWSAKLWKRVAVCPARRLVFCRGGAGCQASRRQLRRGGGAADAGRPGVG